MARTPRRRWLTAVLVLFVLAVIVVGAFATYMAGQAGYLPWQEQPTRIPITPFANLPTVPAEGTPAS